MQRSPPAGASEAFGYPISIARIERTRPWSDTSPIIRRAASVGTHDTCTDPPATTDAQPRGPHRNPHTPSTAPGEAGQSCCDGPCGAHYDPNAPERHAYSPAPEHDAPDQSVGTRGKCIHPAVDNSATDTRRLATWLERITECRNMIRVQQTARRAMLKPVRPGIGPGHRRGERTL